jgi:hypothetical protein
MFQACYQVDLPDRVSIMRLALEAAAVAAVLLTAPAALAQSQGRHWGGGSAPSGGFGGGAPSGGFGGRFQAPSSSMSPSSRWGGSSVGAPAPGQQFSGQAPQHGWRPLGSGGWNHNGHDGGHDWGHDGWHGYRGYYPYYGGYYGGWYDPWFWGTLGFGLSAPFYYGGYYPYYDSYYDYAAPPPPPPTYDCQGWTWDPAAQQYFWGRVAC